MLYGPGWFGKDWTAPALTKLLVLYQEGKVCVDADNNANIRAFGIITARHKKYIAYDFLVMTLEVRGCDGEYREINLGYAVDWNTNLVNEFQEYLKNK